MNTKGRSRILKEMQETAQDFFKTGFTDKHRMRQYDPKGLLSVPSFSGRKIRTLRKRFELSQDALASLLNASLSTVRQWEIGQKHPAGPSAKLLDLLDRKGLEVLI